MGLQGIGNGAAHGDETVDNAFVNFQIDRHTRPAQGIGVQHALVHQRVAFGQADPGRGQTCMVGRVHRSKAPVVAVGFVDVVVKKPVHRLLVEHETLGKGVVRGGVLPRNTAGVKQQLKAQGQARISGHQGAHGGQSAPSAVAAQGQARGVQTQCLAMLVQPVQGVPAVVHRRWKAVLRRQPVVQRHHGAMTLAGELAAQDIMSRQTPDRKTTAVQVQQHGQSGVTFRGIQPGRHGVAISGGDVNVLHPVYPGHGLQVQHWPADVVKLTRLGRCHGGHGRAACAVYPLNQAARGGVQQGAGVGVVAAHGCVDEELVDDSRMGQQDKQG